VIFHFPVRFAGPFHNMWPTYDHQMTHRREEQHICIKSLSIFEDFIIIFSISFMLCLQNYQKLGILSFLFAGGILKGKFHVFFNREGVAIH
jgi:hypothetical protein